MLQPGLHFAAHRHHRRHRIYRWTPDSTYCWRVRYRDRSLEWSAWSTPVTFQTGTSQSGPNLLANGNAENGTTGWTATDGVIESLTAGECNGISPYLGTYYFALGALCTDNAYGRAYQDVDVSGDATAIDAGTATLRYGGWFANWQGSDLPKMALEFRNAGGTLLASAPRFPCRSARTTAARAVRTLRTRGSAPSGRCCDSARARGTW